MAQYPGYGKRWFKAEIYAKYRGKCNLYFLEDNSTLLNVEEKALKKACTQHAWTKLKRADFLKKPFDKKNEKWHAVKVGKGYRSNKYGCKMVDWQTCVGKISLVTCFRGSGSTADSIQ